MLILGITFTDLLSGLDAWNKYLVPAYAGGAEEGKTRNGILRRKPITHSSAALSFPRRHTGFFQKPNIRTVPSLSPDVVAVRCLGRGCVFPIPFLEIH